MCRNRILNIYYELDPEKRCINKKSLSLQLVNRLFGICYPLSRNLYASLNPLIIVRCTSDVR